MEKKKSLFRQCASGHGIGIKAIDSNKKLGILMKELLVICVLIFSSIARASSENPLEGVFEKLLQEKTAQLISQNAGAQAVLTPEQKMQMLSDELALVPAVAPAVTLKKKEEVAFAAIVTAAQVPADMQRVEHPLALVQKDRDLIAKVRKIDRDCFASDVRYRVEQADLAMATKMLHAEQMYGDSDWTTHNCRTYLSYNSAFNTLISLVNQVDWLLERKVLKVDYIKPQHCMTELVRLAQFVDAREKLLCNIQDGLMTAQHLCKDLEKKRQSDAQKFAAQLSLLQQATVAETNAKLTAVAQMVAAQHQNEITQLKLQHQQDQEEKSSLLAQITALKKERSSLTERLQEKQDLLEQAHQARSPLPGRLEPSGKSVGAAKIAEQLLLLRKLQENMLEMQTEMGGDITEMHGAIQLVLAASTSSPV